jgi:hypothetical protein
MREPTLLSLVIIFLNSGKIILTLVLPTPPVTIPLGRRYGTFIPFLDTKLYYGGSFRMLSRFEVP